MENNSDNQESGQHSDKLYSYNEEQNKDNFKYDAMRRSIGDKNPKEPELDHQPSIIHIDQTPPYMWVLFLVFGIIQIIFIFLLGFYFDWDKDSNMPNKTDINFLAKEEIKNKYRYFQDMTIMLFLGFGFLRSFLKHHSWSSIIITLISGVLSFEFALICLITWGSIFQHEWVSGYYKLDFFFDALYVTGSYIISMGSYFGKLSFPQYFVMIFLQTIFSSMNYLLIRQSLKVMDIGGTITVHLFGAVFGCLFSIISYCNKNEIERINTSPHIGFDHNSNLFALFGSLIIIPLWPSFNTALVEANQKYRGIVNTYFSIGGSIIGTFLMSPLLNNKKFKVEDLIYASFPGAIVIGGCCHIIKEYYLCIFFGIISSVFTILAKFLFYEKIKINNRGYHDTSKVLFYHGIPAILGGIISSIFAGNLKNLKNNIIDFHYKKLIGNINIALKLDENINIENKAAITFAGIFITIIIAGLSGLCVGYCIKICNCNITYRYFNDSEFFDVNGNEPFPWIDERVEIKFDFDSKPK